MKAHRGNVSDCVVEWQAFKVCHENQKQLKKSIESLQKEKKEQGLRATDSGSRRDAFDTGSSSRVEETERPKVGSRWKIW
jgi:ribosome assembly protein YihI (activator of Der GTPase)